MKQFKEGSASAFVVRMFRDAEAQGIKEGVWDLLSAIRGPDMVNRDERNYLKGIFTLPIRMGLGVIYPGHTAPKEWDWESIDMEIKEGPPHFRNHMRRALYQMQGDSEEVSDE